MRASYPGTRPPLLFRFNRAYQPPPEPEPDELDGEADGDAAAAAALAPFGVIAHHSPPEALLPFPLVMPAEVSAT
jgi:hypothetical protein